MITLGQYFSDGKGGQKDRRPEHEQAAVDLLLKVERLEQAFHTDNPSQVADICPNTDSEISGSHAGDGDGGFRLSTTKTGAEHSNHRLAHAVDKFDPRDARDKWLDKFEDGKGGNSMLERFGLYREAPDATKGWLHLQDLPPNSKRRTYHP